MIKNKFYFGHLFIVSEIIIASRSHCKVDEAVPASNSTPRRHKVIYGVEI